MLASSEVSWRRWGHVAGFHWEQGWPRQVVEFLSSPTTVLSDHTRRGHVASVSPLHIKARPNYTGLSSQQSGGSTDARRPIRQPHHPSLPSLWSTMESGEVGTPVTLCTNYQLQPHQELRPSPVLLGQLTLGILIHNITRSLLEQNDLLTTLCLEHCLEGMIIL